jgi:signal transduction histidine kinase
VIERFKKTLATGEAQVSKEITEAIRIQVDDEDKWYLVHAFPFDAPDTKNFTYYSSDSNKHSIAAIFQEATVLKLADSLRKNLLATVSHELKTPITSARMSLYLLLEQKLGTLNEDQIDLLETARDDVNRQLATIENLLDLSKIEENIDHFDLSEFSCCEMVEESIFAHTELASSHSINLHYTPPRERIYLLADRNKLRIVLNNFIVNAIKYSGHGSRVEISAEEKHKICRIAVKDDGPGMDEETVRKIFDAYTRGGDPTAVKGTGLGLKISKDIIDGHGGQIGCQSKPGEGSTFFFELPLERTGGTS